MANYAGVGRSNYFKVTDRKAFEEWAEKYDIKILNDDGRNLYVGFEPDNESGDLPSHDPETDAEVDPLEELQKLLPDGEVCVFMAVGNEKLRYLGGYSIAITNKDRLAVSIHDIYAKAAEKFGVKEETISEASYDRMMHLSKTEKEYLMKMLTEYLRSLKDFEKDEKHNKSAMVAIDSERRRNMRLQRKIQTHKNPKPRKKRKKSRYTEYDR